MVGISLSVVGMVCGFNAQFFELGLHRNAYGGVSCVCRLVEELVLVLESFKVFSGFLGWNRKSFLAAWSVNGIELMKCVRSRWFTPIGFAHYYLSFHIVSKEI